VVIKYCLIFSIVEDNPFLGWRGIRVTLDHPEIFLVQVRAMLRASAGLNNLQIMFPMISNIAEVDDALRLLKQAYREISQEIVGVVMPKVGVMVEVPSAVYLASHLIAKVDFLSVGSNDLTQYILAVDRNNSRVANLYDALHPAVLKAISQVVSAAHAAGKPVSICGEMAGDPAAVILLLAMGFDVLSMNATSIPKTKWVLRSFSVSRAEELLAEVLSMPDAISVRRILEQAIDEVGLGGLIRAGK